MLVPCPETGNTEGKQFAVGEGVGRQVCTREVCDNFHPKETSSRQPELLTLEFRENAMAEDKHVGVTSMKVNLKTMRLLERMNG